MPAVNAGQKNLMLSLAKFNATIESAYEESAPHKICAVSYTHLDVYKRQLQQCV